MQLTCLTQELKVDSHRLIMFSLMSLLQAEAIFSDSGLKGSVSFQSSAVSVEAWPQDFLYFILKDFVTQMVQQETDFL